MEGAGVEPHRAERRSRAGSTHNRIASQRARKSTARQAECGVQVVTVGADVT